MIDEIKIEDIDSVCNIINEDWIINFSSFVNPKLVSSEGCLTRKEYITKEIISKIRRDYVYRMDDKVVGFVSFWKNEDEFKKGCFEIRLLYIDKDYQHMGIGTKLLKLSEKIAEEESHKEIIIWTFKDNVKSNAFYKKHNYKIIKEEYMEYPYETNGVCYSKLI